MIGNTEHINPKHHNGRQPLCREQEGCGTVLMGLLGHQSRSIIITHTGNEASTLTLVVQMTLVLCKIKFLHSGAWDSWPCSFDMEA